LARIGAPAGALWARIGRAQLGAHWARPTAGRALGALKISAISARPNPAQIRRAPPGFPLHHPHLVAAHTGFSFPIFQSVGPYNSSAIVPGEPLRYE